MKNPVLAQILGFFCCFLCTLPGSAAVLHFYHNPSVPQALFHVALEYKNYFYEADPYEGGRRQPIQNVKEPGDWRIEISDALVDERALLSQMGLPFDFNFIWGNGKTYCSELVGLALKIEPKPMSFAGTHYLKFHPEWIHRHDPGLSPDDIYQFGLEHGVPLTPAPGTGDSL